MGTQENVRSLAAGKDPKNTALTTAAAAAPTSDGAFGWTSDADKDIAVTTINTNRTRIGEIETALKAAGILPA